MITAERQTCATCKGRALLFRVWGSAAKRTPLRAWVECRAACQKQPETQNPKQ